MELHSQQGHFGFTLLTIFCRNQSVPVENVIRGRIIFGHKANELCLIPLGVNKERAAGPLALGTKAAPGSESLAKT